MWGRGDPYEQYVGRWSRRVAPLFLDWLGAAGGLAWVDVGCGTGALTAAILDGCSPASVVGVDPAPGFIASAREHLGDRASFVVGDAGALPLGHGTGADQHQLQVQQLVERQPSAARFRLDGVLRPVHRSERLGQRHEARFRPDRRRHRVLGEGDERVEMTIDERADDPVAQARECRCAPERARLADHWSFSATASSSAAGAGAAAGSSSNQCARAAMMISLPCSSLRE